MEELTNVQMSLDNQNPLTLVPEITNELTLIDKHTGCSLETVENYLGYEATQKLRPFFSFDTLTKYRVFKNYLFIAQTKQHIS